MPVRMTVAVRSARTGAGGPGARGRLATATLSKGEANILPPCVEISSRSEPDLFDMGQEQIADHGSFVNEGCVIPVKRNAPLKLVAFQ